MQDSRPENRVVRSMMWQAASNPTTDEPRRDTPEVTATEPPGGRKDGKARAPAARKGPGSQIRRYVPQRRAPVPPAPSSDTIKPQD